MTADHDRIAECLDGTPKIVKPLRGHRGAGVEVVKTGADLVGRPQPEGPLIVQDLIEGPGEDLKVYVVGERVWAVRKPFSPTSFSVPGRPVPVTREVEDRHGPARGRSRAEPFRVQRKRTRPWLRCP